MITFKRSLVAAVAVALPALFLAQTAPSDTNARIRAEARDHSQVLQTLHMITDRYGPRVTGSPGHEAAAKWAVQQLTAWGLKNAHLEPWDFGHEGWSNESAEGYLLLPPARIALHIAFSAWTPSTNGPITASAIQMVPPQANREELSAWLDANRDKIKGKIVLIGKAQPIVPTTGRGGLGGGSGNFGGPATSASATSTGPASRPAAGLPFAAEMINNWLIAGGALVRADNGGAGSAWGIMHEVHNRNFDSTKAIPGVILRNEDFGRIERLLADGTDVKLTFNIQNKTYPEGKTSYNVIAEIPGSTKPDEVVMLGAHFDCWHLATGATDNAGSSAMMMEAVRILQTLGLKPLRTIRIGLWSGEEEGLLGSQAYVKEHFGTFETPKPEFEKFLCYFNVDSGAGSIRAFRVFGPPEAQKVLADALIPFADYGASGSSASLSRALGNTDSGSFNHAGLCSVAGAQNSTDYIVTHHTNYDTVEHISTEELIRASTILASSVYEVANRPEKLPQFTKENMPKVSN